MHNAAYAALELDWSYACYPCADEQAFEALLAHGAKPASAFVGLNVTMPYKRSAYTSATHIEGRTARVSEAANVITFTPNAQASQLNTTACNTDGAGVVRFLAAEAQLEFLGMHVVVCGTGPTSAAIIAELAEAQAGSVTVLSRALDKARSFCDGIKARYDAELQAAGQAQPSYKLALHAAAYADYQALEGALDAATLVIDATPVGMGVGQPALIPAALLDSRHTVFDVVYGHGETACMRDARMQGARAYDGLGMLVEQAALSIEVWTAAQGIVCKAPREAMRQAASAELARRVL
jgi:shikimate dehydrogenase